jgi:hypothetical protein
VAIATLDGRRLPDKQASCESRFEASTIGVRLEVSIKKHVITGDGSSR